MSRWQHPERTRQYVEIIKYFHEQGKTFRELCGKRYLSRTPPFVSRYVRLAGVHFPDEIEVVDEYNDQKRKQKEGKVNAQGSGRAME